MLNWCPVKDLGCPPDPWPVFLDPAQGHSGSTVNDPEQDKTVTRVSVVSVYLDLDSGL